MKTFPNTIINNFSETTFIAGSYKEISFYVYTSGCSPLDLSSEVITWELSPYDNQRDVVLTKTATSYNGYVTVQLNSEDTENLSGKYIQHAKINTLSSKQYPLGRGVINIVPAVKTTTRTAGTPV